MRLTERVEVRRIAGEIAVALLKILGRLPLWIPLALGTVLLPLYLPFRPRTRLRLFQLRDGQERTAPGLRGGRLRPYPRVDPYTYYRMRLRLTLLSLRHLLGRPDGCALQVEGREHFLAALKSGKPVVVLGWHQGPVELLHQIPQRDAQVTELVEVPVDAPRAFFLVTAKAFAPALTGLMRNGRGAPTGSATPKEILHPGSMAGLKRWEQEKGILALMVDQVPGKPEEWLAPLDGRVHIPFPGRLLDWIAQRDAEFLVVSAQLEARNRILFRYEAMDPKLLREDLAFHLDRSLRVAPEQYNWSYPKIR